MRKVVTIKLMTKRPYNSAKLNQKGEDYLFDVYGFNKGAQKKARYVDSLKKRPQERFKQLIAGYAQMNFKEDIEDVEDEDPEFQRIVKDGEGASKKINHKKLVSGFAKNLQQYSFTEKIKNLGGINNVRKSLLDSVQTVYGAKQK